MNNNDWKIAWRNLRKSGVFSFLNILGLTLGFTGFILSYQYINRETSYDRWNPNYEKIYQIGLEANGQFTTEILPSFAGLLMEKFPEIRYAGRKIDFSVGNYPLFGKNTVYIRDAIILDSAAARIFQIESNSGALYKQAEQKEASLIKEQYARLLFEDYEDFSEPKSVPVLSVTLGVSETFYGIAKERKLSHIDGDVIFIKEIETEEQGSPFLSQTYIQVKEGTDIDLLTEKTNALFAQDIAQKERIENSSFAHGRVYLDPFANLHLRPKAGSNANYLVIWALGVLSVVILALACANFANMMMAQAHQRLKELAIKKILGSTRLMLVRQLLLEVFMLTLGAAILSYIILLITGNSLQKWFNDDLNHYIQTPRTFIQLMTGVAVCTLLSGIYPAISLSGFKTIDLLNGHSGGVGKSHVFRNGLLVVQFTMAITFVTGMLVVRQQMRFMQETEKGFEPAQVVNFIGVGMYYDSKADGKFGDFKQRLLQDPNIESVTAATNIPGSKVQPPQFQFSYANQNYDIDHVGIDQDFFQTLGIDMTWGHDISLPQLLNDSTKHYAVVNEAFLDEMNLINPIGSSVSGCHVNFEVIGVVKNSKAYGFENRVQPTIYSYKDECAKGRFKSTLLVRSAPGKTEQAIEAVEKEWALNPAAEDLPLDYEFMDQNYAKLQEKQQELQKAFNGFTMLSVVIAGLGLFSMSTYQVTKRRKEMSIRKVLGASIHTLFLQLNKSFFNIFFFGAIMAVPICYLIITPWLNNFAYHIEIRWWYFAIAAVSVLILFLLSVSYQSLKAARENPVNSLRDE